MPAATDTDPLPAGVVKVHKVTNLLTSGSGLWGAPVTALVLPGRTGSTSSYTLEVYGYFPAGPTGATYWLPVPLWWGTVTPAYDTGADIAGFLPTGDTLSTTMTAGTGVPAGVDPVAAPASATGGPAWVLVETEGAPYLYFRSNQAASAFVLVGGCG